jgi:general secretion pathway protein E/type IV pilus assembly protein PilB
LRAVLAQRLVRKICPQCRRWDPPAPAGIAALGLTPDEVAGGAFLRGAGCPHCEGTGYRGRLGIFELLVLDDEISQMIHERPGGPRLRELARARGMRSLREDGARKVIAGLTTIEEVVSVTPGEAR